MPAPTPNGPTLADLQYQSYDVGGNVRVTTGQVPPLPIAVFDPLATRENVVPQLVGYTYSVDTSDVLNTAENVQVAEDGFGPNVVSANVNDASKTSENTIVTAPFAPATTLNAVVNDATVTAENVALAYS